MTVNHYRRVHGMLSSARRADVANPCTRTDAVHSTSDAASA
ncbi:MAG: hypothetical protein P0Y60_04670 [Candidatus Microbacterium colombiense]|nr:MAG: hypothetical protein P0Y60_04670 [Microbacterium sp.]